MGWVIILYLLCVCVHLGLLGCGPTANGKARQQPKGEGEVLLGRLAMLQQHMHIISTCTSPLALAHVQAWRPKAAQAKEGTQQSSQGLGLGLFLLRLTADGEG